MNNNSTNRQLDETKKNNFWNKRIVLVVEISLCVITGMMFVVGVVLENELIEGVFSNCFTALIVTLLGTIVSWNTETDVERTVRAVEEQTTARIADIQRVTQDMASELNTDIESLQNALDSLNSSISSFSGVLDIYNGKACTFCRNYIKDVKFNRKSCNLQNFFATAKNSISILATNLESFVPYLPQFTALAKDGISVRVSAIHPNFARDFNIARVTGNTSPEKRWRDMKDSLMKFAAFATKDDSSGNNFQVRTYSAIAPTLILIMVDNECYVAYLLNGMRASDTIHFLFSAGEEVTTNSPVYYFKKHFESIWSDEGTRECDIENITAISYER